MAFPVTMDRTKGGRPGYAIDRKIGRFKDLAWDYIVDQCEKNPAKLQEYIKLFSSRLMPDNINYASEEKETIVSLEERIRNLEKGRQRIRGRIIEVESIEIGGAIKTRQAVLGKK